jgi:hypothetical protein
MPTMRGTRPAKRNKHNVRSVPTTKGKPPNTPLPKPKARKARAPR